VDAEEALRLGLVSRVFAADAFAGEVDAIVEGIAATAPIPSRYTPVALREGHRDLVAAEQWEALAQPVSLATADLQEGVRAAREKRSPRFRGA
jgi:enoyl-CoA hydratase